MLLHQEAGLQALLARYEREYGETLRRRRQEVAASAAFMGRFGEVCREIVRPCLEALIQALCRRGVPAYFRQSFA